MFVCTSYILICISSEAVNKYIESGENAIDLTAIACASIECNFLFSFTSNIVTIPSNAPHAIYLPLHATLTVNFPFV